MKKMSLSIALGDLPLGAFLLGPCLRYAGIDAGFRIKCGMTGMNIEY